MGFFRGELTFDVVFIWSWKYKHFGGISQNFGDVSNEHEQTMHQFQV